MVSALSSLAVDPSDANRALNGLFGDANNLVGRTR
jgi:hypothetical protein